MDGGRDTPDDLSQQAHRQVIGALGLLLPGLVYLGAGLRPTDGLPPWKLLDSISAYYYTGAVPVFVGVLFALSLFLVTYRGYKGVKADRVVGKLGGSAALIVVLFPTEAPRGVAEPVWWNKATGVAHYLAAVVLFLSFILFSVWLFRKSDTPNRRDRPRDKQVRDHIFLVCGLVMIACVLWAGTSLFTNAPIFVPESIAVIAFAVSWLVKGEAHRVLIEGARRLMRGTAIRTGAAPERDRAA